MGGEVGANIQKIFAYGVRNSFGLAFDPQSGNLWDEQNGDDAFDEINRIVPGANLGWIQFMGPMERIAQFKAIEVARDGGLQQVRWPPTLIADTPAEAMSRLFLLPGALPLNLAETKSVSGHAFPRSMRKPQIRLTSPPCRTPPGQ